VRGNLAQLLHSRLSWIQPRICRRVLERLQLRPFELAEHALRDWERGYNKVRFSMALNGGRTHAEKLAAVLAAA